MKVDARVLDVTSTLEGERIGMTIDEGALAHIMSVLTDLYSDPEAACIREYSTNAFDAHVEAGVKRPIEIVLPTHLAPFLKIRDYGFGLNRDDINEIYSRYGASTKRSSNDLVGQLGLGCKSALTYTDQFTVTGIKDGIMTQVSVSRDEDGTGSMTVVSEGETDEPSGVEIVIPAKRGHSFESKAEKFFQFWTPGTVLVNGKQPERVNGTWIADDLLLTTEVDQSVVVMGNVAYPMMSAMDESSYDYRYNRMESIKTVAFVKIGDVAFTPSREALQAIRKTKDCLALIKDRVAKEKNPAFERIIASAPTKQEAYAKYLEVSRIGYDAHQPRWNGVPLPLAWKHATEQYLMTAPGRKYRGVRGTGKDSSIYNDKSKFSFIVNFDGAEMTSYRRTKLDLYMTRTGTPVPETYVMVESLSDVIPAYHKGILNPNLLPTENVREWFDNDHILDWSVIEKEKVVRENTKRNDGRPSGSYHGIVNSVKEKVILAKDIDTSKPVFYERGSSGYWGITETQSVKTINRLVPDSTIIVLGMNRIKKFTRDFPEAKEISAYLREQSKVWAANLSDDDKLLLHFSENDYMKRTLGSLRNFVDTLEDPALVSAVNIAIKPNSALVSEWQLWSRWGATYKAKFDNPLEKYVLLTHLSVYDTLRGKSQEHLHIYLNAAYAAEKEV